MMIWPQLFDPNYFFIFWSFLNEVVWEWKESYPVSVAAGKKVITIEGLADKGKLHAVQQAWIDHQVP